MSNKAHIDLTDFYNSDNDLTDAEINALIGEPLSESEAKKIVEEVFSNLSPCPDLVDTVRRWDSKEKLDVRHKENRSMKHQIYDWLHSNWDGKNQANATRRLIDAKLCNVKESTLKSWVHDYKKEQLNK